MSGNGCNCGGSLTTTVHEVATSKGVAKWTGRILPGPATVERQVCSSCGRQRIKLTRNGEVIARRG